MRLSEKFILARSAAKDFLDFGSPKAAVLYERQLLALGFYNIEFSPPAACLDGVRYPLTEAFAELV